MSGVFGQRFGRRKGGPRAQLLDELDELALGVLPREVRVRLREPRLGEQGRERRAREGLGQEDRPRVSLAHLGDEPLPERDRLRVGIVDPEGGDARVAPPEHDVANRVPERLPVAGLPVEVVDVLVALRRVLRVLQRPVGPMLEPVGVLDEPRVVGRHLQREIEGELHPVLVERRDESLEVAGVPERRVDRVVPTLTGADRPRAPDVARLRPLLVVPPLAVRVPDRVDGREVHDVEPVRGQLRDDLRHAPEAAPRARKELVPGARACALPLDLDLQRRAARGLVPLRGRRAPPPHPAIRRRCPPRTARVPRRARLRGRPARRPPSGRARTPNRRAGRPRPRPGTASARPRPRGTSRRTGRCPATRAAPRASAPSAAGSGRPRGASRGRRGRSSP